MLHLEGDQIPPFTAEFDPDQMDRLAVASIFVGIAALFDLQQGTPFRGRLHDLEFDEIDLAVEPHGQIQAPGVARLLRYQIESEGGETGVEDARVVAFVMGDRIVASTLMSLRLSSPEKRLTLLNLLTPVRKAKRIWASESLMTE
mgnify:CR=1 FL=1